MNNVFSAENFPLQKETHNIIGVCMEVHRILGRGFLEIVYKDAIEYEFGRRQYLYEREKEFRIQYKETILPHKFFADFVVFNGIILEIKAQNGIADDHYKLLLNYLAVSKCKVGLIVNFGEDSLKWKRLIL